MSVHVVSWAWKLELADPKAKLVLLKLADCANDEGVCWPSVATIVRDTSLSESTVKRRVKLLEELGLLERDHRRAGQRQGSNLYRIGRKRQQVPVSGSESAFSGVQNGDSQGVPGTPEPSVRQPSVEPTSSLRSDAIADEFEETWEAIKAEGIIAPLAKSARAAFTKIVRELVDADVTADEIHRAAVGYRAHPTLGRAMLTLPALAKWMPQVLEETRPKEDVAAEHLRRHLREVLG